VTRKRPKQRAAVGVLGKEITRRSRGRCELCDDKDDTRLYELPPFPDDPDPDRTLLGCARCRRWLETEEIDVVQAHFLSTAVWSEVPAVKLAAARMLLSADFLEDPWLQDALEAANVDPATLEFRLPPEEGDDHTDG
jgi:protein PhnA